ncbi:MAG TPA: glycerol-3-phosphate acyltransferase [Ilumatobacter sp.]|nr:glycerol-3-phosphate acyltransferase [Ilumatobacter sp.]
MIGRIDLLVAAVAGYLIGSIPTAYLVGRLAAGIDVRVEGEGNVGARNTFHVVGKRWGIAVFAADFLKGLVVAALFLGQSDAVLAAGTTAALVGHCFPVWLRFVGGKGLSTVGGSTVAIMPAAALAGTAAAGVVWLVSKRFLPTTVAAIVVTIVAAPLLGASLFEVGLVVWLFALTGVKRAIDEPRMRAIEARTGWDRLDGLGS